MFGKFMKSACGGGRPCFLCTALCYTLYFQKWVDLQARWEADEAKAKSEACALTR